MQFGEQSVGSTSAARPVGINPALVQSMAVERMCAAVHNAFLTMAGLEATTGPLLPPDADRAGEGKLVASLIGWVGEWNGMGVLECTPEFACYLTGVLLGCEMTELNEDALNCVAEMSNIVFGNVKTDLEGVLGAMALQTPTVIYGTGIGMWCPLGDFLVIPVQVGRHPLRVKVNVVRRDDHSQQTRADWPI